MPKSRKRKKHHHNHSPLIANKPTASSSSNPPRASAPASAAAPAGVDGAAGPQPNPFAARPFGWESFLPPPSPAPVWEFLPTPTQQRFLQEMTSPHWTTVPTVTAVCERTEISPSTYYRWSNDPAFMEWLSERVARHAVRLGPWALLALHFSASRGDLRASRHLLAMLVPRRFGGIDKFLEQYSRQAAQTPPPLSPEEEERLCAQEWAAECAQRKARQAQAEQAATATAAAAPESPDTPSASASIPNGAPPPAEPAPASDSGATGSSATVPTAARSQEQAPAEPTPAESRKPISISQARAAVAGHPKGSA